MHKSQSVEVWMVKPLKNARVYTSYWTVCTKVASFPGPARSSLAVQNSRRGPGLVHHVMCAAAYVMTISLRISDVIGWASAAFYVERGTQRSQWQFVRKLS